MPEEDLLGDAAGRSGHLVDALRRARDDLGRPYRKLEQAVLTEGRERAAAVVAAAERVGALLTDARGPR